MPKSKNRKNHKKKVQARNNRIQAQKKRVEKMQREMFEQIMQEAQKGEYENTEQLPDIELIDSTEVISSDLKTDDNLVLLKTNMAGHGGATGRYDFMKEIAFQYAFIFKILDMIE